MAVGPAWRQETMTEPGARVAPVLVGINQRPMQASMPAAALISADRSNR
jgi:hypothetical protein